MAALSGEHAHYASSLDHVLDETVRIDLLIGARLAELRQVERDDDKFRGLYVSEADVDALIAHPLGQNPAAEQEAMPDGVVAKRDEIARRKVASLERGMCLRLDRLARLFDLSPFDVDALLVCLAPGLDLRYERLYAYLQDDVTRKRPSVDLVLGLLCASLGERIAARERFAPGAPLLKGALITLVEDSAQPSASLLGQYLKMSERVVAYLLGSDALDADVADCCQLIDPQGDLDEMALPAEDRQRLLRMTAPERCAGQGLILCLRGAEGVGRRHAAQAACRRHGIRLLTAAGRRLKDRDPPEFERVARLVLREALLQEAALFLADFDGLLAEDKAPHLGILSRLLEEHAGLTFLATAAEGELIGRLGANRFIQVDFPSPAYHDRLAIWTRALADVPQAQGIDLAALAGQFRLTRGHVRDACEAARNMALWREPERPEVTMADLQAACRARSNRKLAELAQKIEPRYGWDDIVLPPPRLRQLEDVYAAARYGSLVYDEWGFGAKLALGKGLAVLFSGPSGTGKTMAAEIIAGALGLELYKIDLSAVVSKYIGETEKNLARIFAEAESANAILFFDEADALFGKRSEVRDAHDRYANIETGYLLQRMEAYEGLAILATNLYKNLDEAFVRRLHFVVEFPFPNAADRRRIWAGVWPSDTPRTPDLDLDLMATRFELAGGNIKNIALAGAFMAAADGGIVTQKHLLRATEREYQKMGKVIMAGDFEWQATGTDAEAIAASKV